MSISICDVSPRDGLQNEAVHLAPPQRAELATRLAAAGVPRVEAVSFVRPELVPRMAGAEQVVAALEPADGVTYAGLTLNVRGYERLAAVGLPEVHVTYAATETFNRRNQNASVEESLRAAAEIVTRAQRDGRRATVTIAAAFGCPFEGRVEAATVIRQAEAILESGPDELIFADTIGVGVPTQVRRLVGAGVELGIPVGVHLHNTRNTGIANAYAAVDAGASVLDASVGGVGGCPFAPRATGNIATEDLVYLLHGEGIDTGIDLDALIAVAEWLAGLLGHELPGQVHRAGTFAPVAG